MPENGLRRGLSLALGAALALILLAATPRIAVADPPSVQDLKPATSGAPDGPSTQAYSAAYYVHLLSGTSNPVYTSHPVGVPVWRIFGGTYFLSGDYAQVGKSRLVMQSDGNFVLYDENGPARWAVNRFGNGNYATIQRDGNLVVYNSSGAALWASNTCCNSGYDLMVQNDGNVVIYAPNWRAVWATGTNH